MSDLFNNIDPDAPVDDALMKEIEERVSDMGKTMVSGKMKEATLIQQSIADGGPDSTNSAIFNLMSVTKVGIRRLAKETKVNRKLLIRMIEGITPMPPEVLSSIYDLFKRIRPDLFAFEKDL